MIATLEKGLTAQTEKLDARKAFATIPQLKKYIFT
jgi:hypothetical protein